jgi:hypothetical protein
MSDGSMYEKGVKRTLGGDTLRFGESIVDENKLGGFQAHQ